MLSILSLVFGLLTFAQSEKVVTLHDRSQVFVVTSLTQSVDQPTFIFLPGIYRGLYSNEVFLQKLTAQKINWIAMHFSRHPESVLAGTPLWLPVTSSQLANEVVAVRRAFKIEKPIIVSLSFSASVIPALNPKEFPVVVETAPMGRPNETVPPQQNANYNSTDNNWMAYFSGMQFWAATSDYWNYRLYWMNEVMQLSEKYPIYKTNSIYLAEGLAQLAFSSRGFDLRNQDFKNGPKRFWILAENEEPLRLKYQMAAVQLYRQQRADFDQSSFYVVPGAEHVLPTHKPQEYVLILNRILKSVARQ